MPTDPAPEVLYSSDTDEPTVFVWDGETVINYGEVALVAIPDPVP